MQRRSCKCCKWQMPFLSGCGNVLRFDREGGGRVLCVPDPHTVHLVSDALQDAGPNMALPKASASPAPWRAPGATPQRG
jgi:hypothetical protein